MATTPEIYKGFVKDWFGNKILPITRGELVLDVDGNAAFASEHFLAKDGHPGLVTAAERAMLTGSGVGGGISDIYTKLGYINDGLSINNTPVHFYNSSTGAATPISILSTGDGSLNIGVSNNTVSVALAELNTSETTVSQILKSIKVDKYGRVTEVSGSALTNADIPDLSGKTIQESTLKGCVTDVKEIGNNELAIVNKAYVDSKFANATTIATGALKFAGPLTNKALAESALTSQEAYYSYYKVTKDFYINTSDLYDTAGILGETLQVQVGDSLIIYPDSPTATRAKFVYIPSGNDITTISVTKDNMSSPVFNGKIGDVVLKFSGVFDITNPGEGNTAYISLPKASDTQDGYLSKADYTSFKAVATQLKVEYTGEFTEGSGVYKISGLSLENGSGTGDNAVYNPILKFTETGESDVQITLKGYRGIVTKKNGNDIEILAANELAAGADAYLSLEDGYKFGVKIGSLSNNVVTNGLTDFAEFNTFRANVLTQTVVHDIIDYSLTDTTKAYHYGSVALKAAVTLTI